MTPPQIATDDDVALLCSALGDVPWACVDTEFHSESRYIPDLYLVQVALPDGRCWIVDALRPDHLARLAEPLCAVTWVVHGGTQDMIVLQSALGALPARVWDSQIVAGLVGTAFPATFASLVESWLGRHVEKASTLSDWSARPLSPRQLAYARADVVVLIELWGRLYAAAETLGRLEIAGAACDEARARVVGPPDHREDWRSLGAAWTLPPRAAAALQELVAWREAAAREEGVPARRIVGDAVLVDVARRRPIDLPSLMDDRRLPKGLARRRGPELLAALGAAARRPESDLPVPVVRHSEIAARAAFYELIARVTGFEGSFASDLVMPRSLAEDLASAGPGAADRLSGWRGALVGDAIRSAENGRSRLTLTDGVVRLVGSGLA